MLPLTSSGFNGRPRSMASPSSEWMRGNILYSCHYVHVVTGHYTKEGLNNPHLGRNAMGCGSKIRFEDLSER